MQTAAVWLALVLIGVGFPAGAWAVGRRMTTSMPPEDAYGFSQRHGLSAADAALLERALRTGTRLSDPALRPLVVERASALLDQMHQRRALVRRLWWPVTPWAVARTALVVGVLVALILAAADVMRTRGDPLPLAYVVLYGSGGLLAGRFRNRRLRRARTANQDDGAPVRPAPTT